MDGAVTPSAFFKSWPLNECRKSRGAVPFAHQELALKSLDEWARNLRGEGAREGGLLVLPTGGGKTFTAVRFLCAGPLSEGYKVLWLAHTHHLLEQAFEAFSERSLGHIREPRAQLNVRVVSGAQGHFPPRDIKSDDDVVLATLQTINSALKDHQPQLTQFLDSAGEKLFVVFDEAHHAPAPSFRRLLQNLPAPVLGLTATPTYTDQSKQGWLLKLFPSNILFQASVPKLIADGILAKPIPETVHTDIEPKVDERDIQRWMNSFGDIPEHIIDRLAESRERNSFIASTYANERARYGKTIIFTDRWYQCEAIASELERLGVKAGAVYSHLDATAATVAGRRKRTREDNDLALKAFKDGELEVLLNVRMLTEGTDVPQVQTVFLTRKTTSQILLTQMVGRALRGPKAGGTETAYIVSFVDNWQQSIRWAEYDQLLEGQADDGDTQKKERGPLQYISIELLRRLTAQMAGGVNVAAGAYISSFPVGWYLVSFDAADGDDTVPVEQLTLVFENEKVGFEKLIDALMVNLPAAFQDERVTLEQVQGEVERWRAYFLANSSRSVEDLRRDVFFIARHIGQDNGAPRFFTFEQRKAHDLDALASRFIEQDIGPRAKRDALSVEYAREDRFWKSLYWHFEQFEHAYQGCESRKLRGNEPQAPTPNPRADEVPSEREPSEEVKEQVKRRDQWKCLACGEVRRALLEVDHVIAWKQGGSNESGNLQTLCAVCNNKKGTKQIDFRQTETTLDEVPEALVEFSAPENVGDLVEWERFLRRTINFTLKCAAVASVNLEGRDWEVALSPETSPQFIEEFAGELSDRISEAREGGGEDALESLTFVGGEDEPEEEEAASPSVVKMRVRVGDTVLDLESQAIGIVKGTLAGELSVLWESESSIKVNRAEVQPLAEAIAEKLEGGGRSIKGVTFRGNSTLRKLMELFGYRAVKRLNKDSLRKVWNQLERAGLKLIIDEDDYTNESTFSVELRE